MSIVKEGELTALAVVKSKDPKARDEVSLDFAGYAAEALGQEVYIAKGGTGEIVGAAYPSGEKTKSSSRAFTFGGTSDAYKRIFGHDSEFDPSRGKPIQAG